MKKFSTKWCGNVENFWTMLIKKCGKCVKYCPGNALLGNYDMNPKRCLSYITQKKGELEVEEERILKENNKKEALAS